MCSTSGCGVQHGTPQTTHPLAHADLTLTSRVFLVLCFKLFLITSLNNLSSFKQFYQHCQSKKTKSKQMVASKTSTPSLHTPSSPSPSTPLSSSLPSTSIMDVALHKTDEPPDTPDTPNHKSGQSPFVNTPLKHRTDFASVSHSSNDDFNQASPHSCNAFQVGFVNFAMLCKFDVEFLK